MEEISKLEDVQHHFEFVGEDIELKIEMNLICFEISKKLCEMKSDLSNFMSKHCGFGVEKLNE